MSPAHPHASIERWFLTRGLSSLLNDTRLRTSTSVRAVPLLVVLYLLALVLTTPYVAYSVWAVLAIGISVLLATWITSNLLRGRRPLARIARIGWFEGAVFVAVPTALVLLADFPALEVSGEHVSASLVRAVTGVTAALGQVVILLAVLAVVRTGALSILIHLARQIFQALGETGTALARTLPLLLGVVVFVFLSAEVWQSIGRLNSLAYAGILLLFVVLSGFFLSSRQHLDVAELATFRDEEEFRQALADTPLRPARCCIDFPATTPLTAAQSANLRLVAVISRLAVASIVATGVLGFFLVFGAMAINADVVKAWSGANPEIILSWSTRHHSYALTWEHLRVTGFLAVFAGFYFSVVSATDTSLRAGLRDTSTDTVREACAARLAVLTSESAQAPSNGVTPAQPMLETNDFQ